MFRSLHVVLTTAALLVCPYHCRTECHSHDAVSGAQVQGQPCGDECAEPAEHSDLPKEDQHEDCSCLCCAGGLPKSDVVVVASATAGEFVTLDDSQASATMCQTSARNRWRAAAPLPVSPAGRELRSWIVSYVI